MVRSILDNTINYIETRNVDKIDYDYTATIYDVKLYKIPVKIALGQLNNMYQESNSIIFFPIYLVQDNKAVLQIGVFEILANTLPDILDKVGDIDLGLVDDPLIYSFIVSNLNLLRDKKNVDLDEDKESDEGDERDSTSDETSEGTSEDENKDESDKDESDKDESDKEKSSKEKLASYEKAKSAEYDEALEEKAKEEDIESEKDSKKYSLLLTQTKDDYKKERAEFKAQDDSLWIENYLHSNSYNIEDNEGGGDCLFAVIRGGLARIDRKISVLELREKVAAEMDEKVFNNYKEIYDGLKAGEENQLQELKDMVKKNKELKAALTHTLDRKDKLLIIGGAKDIQEKFQAKKDELAVTQELLGDYNFMKNIKSVQDFKKLIKTCDFWAEAWTIGTLERILNIKLIIFSKTQYDAGDYNNVLQCGEASEKLMAKGIFEPTHYILVDFQRFPQAHYQLITYKKRGALTFKEIPYYIKELVANKCMEKQAGPFYLIPDFKNFDEVLKLKSKSRSTSLTEDIEIEADQSLFDDKIQFQFYSKSNGKPLPGKGAGEFIPIGREIEFSELAQIPEWRKKLSNFWGENEMLIDGKRWKSVEHFYQASKFKEGYPDFYLQFSLDSGSDISKDPSLAKAAGGKTGKRGKDVLRPKHIVMDKDFDKSRDKIMEKAQYVKFTSNDGLKKLLKATGKAKLAHFRRGDDPEVFYTMMRVRNLLEK